MPYRKQTWIRWITSVPEPRSVRFGYLLAYVLWAIAGISVLIQPPTSLSGAVGEGLTYLWGAFLAVGGTVGAGTVLTYYWYLERFSIWLTGAGVAVYGILVGSMHILESGNRLPQLMFILAGLVFLVVRYLRIKGPNIQPGK